MAAEYYGADSENGDHIDDPSEDALFMLISDLNDAGNTFVVIQPDEDEPDWFASVSVLDEGGYEVVQRDTNRREHDVSVETAIGRIAGEPHQMAGRPHNLKHGPEHRCSTLCDTSGSLTSPGPSRSHGRRTPAGERVLSQRWSEITRTRQRG